MRYYYWISNLANLLILTINNVNSFVLSFDFGYIICWLIIIMFSFKCTLAHFVKQRTKIILTEAFLLVKNFLFAIYNKITGNNRLFVVYCIKYSHQLFFSSTHPADAGCL